MNRIMMLMIYLFSIKLINCGFNNKNVKYVNKFKKNNLLKKKFDFI